MTSTVAVSPVTVVTVSTVPSPVTAVQTVPLLPAALPHSVAQPTAAIPAFPPVMVPPFRVPLPGMHIPLPGKNFELRARQKYLAMLQTSCFYKCMYIQNFIYNSFFLNLADFYVRTM